MADLITQQQHHLHFTYSLSGIQTSSTPPDSVKLAAGLYSLLECRPKPASKPKAKDKFVAREQRGHHEKPYIYTSARAACSACDICSSLFTRHFSSSCACDCTDRDYSKEPHAARQERLERLHNLWPTCSDQWKIQTQAEEAFRSWRGQKEHDSLKEQNRKLSIAVASG